MRKFKVWSDDQDASDAKRVVAMDEEQAAELWAEWSDAESANYLIVQGNDVFVIVEDDCDTRYEFVVSGEAIPSYSAHPRD